MRDALINATGLTGFAAMEVGLWWMSPAAALVVGGAICFGVAIYAARLRAEKK